MKILNSIVLAFIISALITSCDKDEAIETTCDSENGVMITDQIGRIYKWTNSQPHFFYIGNITKVSSGFNGGFIPCNGLPNEFQVEDMIIQYSGIDKGTLPDTDDPLFAYMSLSKIEKAE
ncbi:MAG: hypothetical protein KIT62_10185 [Cyclobacteriaceae bacterium]|nr:hypothetical protein [Cyclobacteriaceae bacterium]